MLHPGEVAALGGRHPGEVAAIGIAGPDFVAPLLQREGRIGDDAVEGGEAVPQEKGGIPQGVATHDLKVRRAVQKEVHAGDGGGGQILLLTVEPAPKRADIAPCLLHMMDGLQQHAARAAGGIVNGLALVWVEDVHHGPHDGAWGVELSCFLVRGISGLFDQVFVGLPQHIRLGLSISQGEPGEVLDEITQQGIGKPVFIRPLRIAKDAIERVRV